MRPLPFMASVGYTDYSFIVRTPYQPVLRTVFLSTNGVHSTERLVHNAVYGHATGGECMVLCPMCTKAYSDDAHVYTL